MGKKKALFFSNKGIIPLENIISEWKFEDNVLDTVGNNNGINYGVDYVNGLVGKAGSYEVVQFSTDRILINNPIGLSFTDNVSDFPFSTSNLIFVKTDSEQRIIKKSNSLNTFTEYYITIKEKKIRVFLVDTDFSNGYVFWETVNEIDFNLWFHLSCVYDGLNMGIYINGVLQATTKTEVGNYVCMKNTTQTDLVFGHNYINNSSTFEGYLDCIRFWNKELSSEEVLEIATKELNGIDINP